MTLFDGLSDNSFTKFSIKQRALSALRYGNGSSDEGVHDDRGHSHQKRFQLEWFPIRPGTIRGTIDGHEVYDNGHGLIYTHERRLMGVITYCDGKVRLNSRRALDYCLCYSFMPEEQQVQRFHMRLTTAPVVARVRKLRARWTEEPQQNLEYMYALGQERERRIIRDIRRRLKPKKKRGKNHRTPRKAARNRH